ncbi:MAG: 50S ribosomal protein L23, partial [Acidobacteriota bacterium]|nr:50S ribosomal protein L23 [Acidobacteriota bacterium]
MKNEFSIVRQPLITEKSTILREKNGTYCFRVHPNANKLEIAAAIEKLFVKDNVKVATVRTARVLGKTKRMGRFLGSRPNWKKAWVQLTPDSGEI